MMANEESLAALENFIVNNPDLERLELLLAQFNIFEVMGAVHQELRHSDFLSYLLKPQESHGLGDYFVRHFLQTVVSEQEYENLPFTGIDLDVWDLSDLSVRREYHGIDILLLSEKQNFSVIIENKVESGEHSNQLSRYYSQIQKEFPDWKKLGVFLTPDGETASDNRYLPISYLSVCELIEDIIHSRESSIGPDVLTLMAHYTRMLRRHIVTGSEIEELCQRIYQKHQKALDMIYENRPDLQSEIYSLMMSLVKNEENLILDDCIKTEVRFFPKALEGAYMLEKTGDWTSTNRILLFIIHNYTNSLKVGLFICPGKQEIREKLFEIVQKDDELFNPSRSQLTKRHLTIYKLQLLTGNELIRAASMEDVEDKILQKWQHFLNNDLPNLIKVFQEQDWIWESI